MAATNRTAARWRRLANLLLLRGRLQIANRDERSAATWLIFENEDAAEARECATRARAVADQAAAFAAQLERRAEILEDGLAETAAWVDEKRAAVTSASQRYERRRAQTFGAQPKQEAA